MNDFIVGDYVQVAMPGSVNYGMRGTVVEIGYDYISVMFQNASEQLYSSYELEYA